MVRLEGLLSPEVMTVCLLGIGGPVIALVELAAGSKRSGHFWRALQATLAGTLALIAAAAWWRGEARSLWGGALVLAAFGGGLSTWRRALALLTCLSLAVVKRPLVRWGVLLAAGPCAGLGWACLLERECAAGIENYGATFDDDLRAQRRELKPSPVVTDAGRPVAVFVLPESIPPSPTHAQREKAIVQDPAMTQRLIRLGPLDPRSNCFGWVFTNGRYWIRNAEDVESILHDNGYQKAVTSQVGDLVVYRSIQGRISHVGNVRLADADGLTLIESKWGALGRFLHGPKDQCYGDDCTYYRSSRAGHVLRGVETESADDEMATVISHVAE